MKLMPLISASSTKTKGKQRRNLSYRDALLEAQSQAMQKDAGVFILGQGVNDAGAIFGSTKGLMERFGGQRVMDTPIAENGITGIAIGAAIAGLRPVLVHMRPDFMLLSMDQIINHAAKWHYMFGGSFRVPLTIRSVIGRGWGSGAQHSQSIQALFTHIPGLKVVMPSTPYDAKGLLYASIFDNNPVIFMEHREIYGQTGLVPKDPYKIPFGKGIIRRAGTDATIVAVSQMVTEALKAADSLAKGNIECEVIDPRTLKPLDTELIVSSVRKTGRLVIADTGCIEGGVSAEISARVTEEAFGFLSAPPLRVGLPDCPAPASSALEKAFYPGRDEIIKAVKKVISYDD